MKPLPAAVLALGLAGFSPSDPVIQACRDQSERFGLMFTEFLRDGTIVSFRSGGAIVEVDDRKWRTLHEGDRRYLGIAAFCRIMGPDGRGTVAIYGREDAAEKATMVDGIFELAPTTDGIVELAPTTDGPRSRRQGYPRRRSNPGCVVGGILFQRCTPSRQPMVPPIFEVPPLFELPPP